MISASFILGFIILAVLGSDVSGRSKRPVTPERIEKEISRAKSYYLFIYLLGPDREQDTKTASEIQQQHLAYLFSLRDEGKLVLQGPVLEDTDLRGIGILNVRTREEADRIVSNDPAVKAGRLKYEMYEWMGMPGDRLP